MKHQFDRTLLKIAEITRGRISRPQTLSDFLAYCALLLSIRTDPVHTEQRSKSLERLKANYKKDEWEAFYQGLVDLCRTFVSNIQVGRYEDLFAGPFTQVRATSQALKQDFTPVDVGKLIGAISVSSNLSLPEEGFFSLSDHACGSGTLLLAGAQRIADTGYNPAEQLVIQAADLDARCVHMTYLHLSLYGIPAVVVQGNTITLNEYDRWYIPVYLWRKWIWRAPMPFGDSGYISDEKLKCFSKTISLQRQIFQVICTSPRPTRILSISASTTVSLSSMSILSQSFIYPLMVSMFRFPYISADI